MCFAPQRRALFRHLNFQKGSEAEVFCTFWLGNVLRATTACTFSTSQLPKVVRTWGVLYLLTWKCASRHNGVQFFIAPVASWLRTRRFSEPTFRPSWATNHWKNTVFRDFPTFSRIFIFFLLILSLLTLLTSAFQLSILSEVSLLNFLRQLHYITLDYTNYITLQYTTLQFTTLHCATTTATATTALHHTTSSSCGWGNHCNHRSHSKKDNCDHLSVHQWVCSAIHASQQLTSPIVSYLWNFRHIIIIYIYTHTHRCAAKTYWTSSQLPRKLVQNAGVKFNQEFPSGCHSSWCPRYNFTSCCFLIAGWTLGHGSNIPFNLVLTSSKMVQCR